MEFVYTESIDKVIKAEIAKARAEGKRVSGVILSPEEFEELQSIIKTVKVGDKFRGCVISVSEG